MQRLQAETSSLVVELTAKQKPQSSFRQCRNGILVRAQRAISFYLDVVQSAELAFKRSVFGPREDPGKRVCDGVQTTMVLGKILS